MGAIRQLSDRVEIEFELDRLLKAPVMLWEAGAKNFIETINTIEDVFIAILWLKLCSLHPEMIGTSFKKSEAVFNKEKGAIVVSFTRKLPTSERQP